MTCQECIYWKRCQADMIDDDDMEYQKRHCTIGEPKADYLKKPCNVEDLLYVIVYFDEKSVIEKATVENLSYTEGTWDIELCYESGRLCLHTEEEIGETIFKTKEEAEKALLRGRKNEL